MAISKIVTNSVDSGVTLTSPTLVTPVLSGSVTGTYTLAGTPIVATTLGVGGATPSASGSGISFPATQSASTDANTLDDYEDGTWTPIVNGQNQQTCLYNKVGRLVTLAGDITLSFTGGAQYNMSGLPFTSSVTQYGNALPYQTNTAATLTMLVTTSSAVVNFYNGQAAQQSITTGSRIIFTITYFSA